MQVLCVLADDCTSSWRQFTSSAVLHWERGREPCGPQFPEKEKTNDGKSFERGLVSSWALKQAIIWRTGLYFHDKSKQPSWGKSLQAEKPSRAGKLPVFWAEPKTGTVLLGAEQLWLPKMWGKLYFFKGLGLSLQAPVRLGLSSRG